MYESSSVTLLPKAIQLELQPTDMASLLASLFRDPLVHLLEVGIPGKSQLTYLSLTWGSRDPKLKSSCLHSKFFNCHAISLALDMFITWTFATWTDEKMLRRKQCDAQSQAKDLALLTCWKLQAVATHRGSELLHQNNALVMEGPLQHRDDGHNCQTETQLSRP